MREIRTGSALGLMSIMGLHGVGPATAFKLACAFRTFDEMLSAPAEAFKGVATEPNRKLLTNEIGALSRSVDTARAEIAKAEELGASVISLFDPEYPARLAGVQDRPLVLYVSGDLSILDRSVACVGTRNPSEFGEIVAGRMSCALAEAGWNIVSGLANGIDAIAHEAALRSGAKTVAVIGSGIDTYQSRSSIEMLERILEEGGAVLTEQPLGRRADPASLVRRNRIQTGVSVATFVMQCDLESGTMHTVRYALHQGRPVLAPMVPDRFASEPANQGTVTMLRFTGPELAEHLVPAPSKQLRKILEEEFADRPVARGIAGKDAYPEILRDLESWRTGETARAPYAPALT